MKLLIAETPSVCAQWLVLKQKNHTSNQGSVDKFIRYELLLGQEHSVNQVYHSIGT